MGKTEYSFKWPLVGNEKIIEYWEKRLASGQDMSGTLIFAGPEGLGKTTLARHLAQVLLCANYQRRQGVLPCGACPSCHAFRTSAAADAPDRDAPVAHGDCHILRPPEDKKNIPVEAVREFIRLLSMSAFLGRAKVGIIKDAQRLSQEAANALLKTLEEPRSGVTIILTADDVESLPRTIASRSQVFNFRPVKSDRIYEHLVKDHAAGRSLARDLARLALGRPAMAVKYKEDQAALAGRLAQARTLVAFAGQDLNERLLAVGELVPAEAAGQEAARRAYSVLESWQGAVRDLLLLEYGQDDRVQHQAIADELKRAKARLPLPRLLALARRLEQAMGEVGANVNPRLVLEAVAIMI